MSRGANSPFETVQSISELVLKLALVVVVAITGYYIYATLGASDQLFRGIGSTPGQAMSVQEFSRHVINVRNLTLALHVAAAIGMVTALIRFYDMAEGGAGLLFLGLALGFGMPMLIDTQGGPATGLPRGLANQINPRTLLKAQFAVAGLILAVPGGLHLLIHGIMYVAGARARRPQADAEAARTASKVRTKQDKFMGKCWELPFCRDTEKKLCPIRETNQPCWRKGRGCYCDQNIILRLSGGGQGTAVHHPGQLRSAVVRTKSWTEKRAQCLGCPVYLHHQQQKYSVLAPGTLLSIIAVFVVFWTFFSQVYPNAMRSFGRAMAGLSFGPQTDGVPQWAGQMADNPGVGWMIIIVMGTLLLAYSLQIVEWILYKLGI